MVKTQKKSPRSAISIRLTPELKARYYRCKDWVRENRGTSQNRFGLAMVYDTVVRVEKEMENERKNSNT